jgi:hypothetical protein
MSSYQKIFKFRKGTKGPTTSLYLGYFSSTSFLMCFDSRFWFDLELKNYERLYNKRFIPKIINVDYKKYLIEFEYHDANLNHLLHYEIAPTTWEKDVRNIKTSLESSGFFKINFYPHTFFYINDELKIFDLYACLKSTDQILEDKLTPIINDKNRFHFQNGYLDVKSTYNYTIYENSGNWPTKLV